MLFQRNYSRIHVDERNDANERSKKLTIIDTETGTRASNVSEQRRTTFRITRNT